MCRSPSYSGCLDQPTARRILHRGLEDLRFETGARLEAPERKSLVEPQRIQHEFKRQIGDRDEVALPDPDTRFGDALLEVARLLGLRRAQDLAGQLEAQLSMGSGAEAEVVAELPVIEIVPALKAVAGVRGNFILPVAGSPQLRLAFDLYPPCRFIVGQRRRARVEYGAGLEGELVVEMCVGASAHAVFTSRTAAS